MISIRNCLLCAIPFLLFLPSIVGSGQIASTAVQKAYVDGRGTAREVAQEAWNVDKTTIRPADLAGFGFSSMSQLDDVKLGNPIPIFTLQQYSLAKYQQGQSLLNLLSPVSEIKYPLETQTGVVSAVSVVNVNGRWVPGVLGNRVITTLLQQASKRLVESQDKLIMIEVPALHKYLIADFGAHPSIRMVVDAYGRETLLNAGSTLNFQLNIRTGLLESSATGACTKCVNETHTSTLPSKTTTVLSDLAQEARDLQPPQ